MLHNMSLEAFSTSVNPKMNGTKNLIAFFPDVDNVLMFSSVATVTGNRGQANYASGCSFQDAVATSNTSEKHMFTLNLPLIEGSDVDNKDDAVLQRSMYKLGLTPISFEELMICVNYALGPESRERGVKQLAVGIDGQRIIDTLDGLGCVSSMFTHMIKKTATSSANTGDAVDRNNAHIGINSDLGVEEVLHRMTIAIANRISGLIAMDYADIEVDVPILEFGLDSLVAIELKNWIVRTFQTTAMDTSEILGQSGIRALAQLTAERSSLINFTPTAVKEEVKADADVEEIVVKKSNIQLQRQPLLDLDTLFTYYLANHRAIWSDEE